jgi:probable F420-dependent oxidoreductase
VLTVRFVFQYPETTGTGRDMLDAGPVEEVARAAEDAGFDAIGFTEHPVPGARWLDRGGHQTLDPLVALAYAGAATSRLQLLTYLVVAPYRNPFLLAKAAATVDRLSGGRLILGMGTGYQKSEFSALGVDMEERNELFDEALDVLPLHWSGEPFSYEGRHFSARDVIARPLPAQDPIPVWIGGNSKLARRRAGERAQGWMPLLGPPTLSTTARTSAVAQVDDLGPMIAEVREMAAPRGTPIDVLCSYVDPSIASPGKEADRHREAFAHLEDLGITWLLIGGQTETASATMEFLETFGTSYLGR